MNEIEIIIKKNREELLSLLGIENLKEEEKEVVANQLFEHFNKIIIETSISALNNVQIKEFTRLMSSSLPEEAMEKIFAETPGLKEKIQDALEKEAETIKIAYNNK